VNLDEVIFDYRAIQRTRVFDRKKRQHHYITFTACFFLRINPRFRKEQINKIQIKRRGWQVACSVEEASVLRNLDPWPFLIELPTNQ
jgi:hypothetical protein